jgi:hypothetical protein
MSLVGGGSIAIELSNPRLDTGHCDIDNKRMTLLDYFCNVTNFLVVEEPYPHMQKEACSTDVGQSSDNMNQQGKKDSTDRWKYINQWHIIEPSKHQLYVVINLRNPHYQVGKHERAIYIKALKKKTENTSSKSVILYIKTQEYTSNDFITVVNDESGRGKLEKLALFISFNKMWTLIEKYKEVNKVDGGRGNIFFDRGLSSNLNQMRSNKVFGLSVPRLCAVNGTMAEEDKQFCFQAEKLLMGATQHYLPEKCLVKQHMLYMVPPENKLFMPDPTMCFPTTRYALTNPSNVLNIHIDKMNPTEYHDLKDSFMNQPVACYSSMQDEQRVSLIGYPRDSVIQASLCYMKYRKCLETIINFYHEVPPFRKDISVELVAKLLSVVKQTKRVHQLPVNLNKFVFYSIFIDRNIEIIKKHQLCVFRRIPLVYAAILSKIPDHFMKATGQYVCNPKVEVPSDIFEFALQLYDDVWDLKLAAWDERKKNKGKNPIGGQ